MITPATSNAFSIALNSQTVHATTTYNLSLTLSVPHALNDYLSLSINPSMAFVGPSCAPISGISSLNCNLYNSTTLNITLTSNPSSTIQISLISIRNYDVSSTPIPFQIYIYNSGGYAMETTSVYSITYNPDTITTITINNNNQIALY
jgi:hypothetical protein